MSTTTNITSRFPFEPHIADMPPQQQYVIRNLWNVAFDAQNAIPILKSQIDANKTAVDTVTNTINNTSSETIVQQTGNAYGTLNNQTGNTSYATTQADEGSYILFSDASPVAVSLATAPTINLPWTCVMINEGIGLVTVTPASGSISYPNNLAASSMPITQGQAAVITYDGINFYSVIIPVAPQNTPSVAHQWINAFNSITGVFSQTQPSFSDLSGQIVPSTQMPASGVTAGNYSLASVTVNSEGLVTAASNGPTGLSVTITTAALTPTGTQGSMTFSSGILTSQTPAT